MGEGPPTLTAGVLLAAGESKRMGGASKLLLPFRGRPLVRWAGEVLAGAGAVPVVAVLGREDESVRQALQGLGILFTVNSRFREGMATSIVAGISALPPECRVVIIALGDMPSVHSETVRGLVQTLKTAPEGIGVPIYHGRRGHPVVFDLRRYRTELLALTGDQGARSILARHPEDVLEIPVEDAGVLEDIDSPEDYAKMTEHP